jgi:hypothetical protein
MASASPAKDRVALLKGVEALPKVGIPGPVAVFGDDAFAVLTGRLGGLPRAVVAAARFGSGRVVAFGHGGYFGPNSTGKADGGRLLTNAVRWTAHGDRTPRVYLAGQHAGLQAFLTQQGFSVAPLPVAAGGVGPRDVVVWIESAAVPPERLVRHVRGGGGLLTAVCPWGVQQIRGPSGFVLHEDLPQNRALAPMGLVFALGYLEGRERRFAVADSRPEVVHAGAALEALKAGRASGAEQRLLADTVRALPGDAPFLAQLKAQLPSLDRGPTRASPFEDPATRLAVSLAFHMQRSLAPEAVEAAPGAEAFPGAVPAEAPRVERRLELDPSTQGWHSTGLYVPAGEVVTLRPQGDGGTWTARVGCHTDRLWSLERWKRWPEISRTWPLPAGSELRLASPFGGLLYLEPGEGARALSLAVNGVVEAPRFDLADPASAAAWGKRREAPGPWAELAGRGLILTVPSASVRDLEDPAALMTWWDRVIASHDELARIPLGARSERFVADVQISAGYMHSGYPIMTHLDVATPKDGRPAKVLHLEHLAKEGSWGHFHELGHNRQEDAWTFQGTGEVTCNLFTLYAMEKVVGIEPWEHPWLKGGRKRAPEHLAAGAPYDVWKRDPGVALVFYAEVQRAFGWEPFQAVLREYARLPGAERPRNDADKRDQWLLRLSRAVGRDLGPFFLRWGIPTSAGAREALSDLEPWQPGR